MPASTEYSILLRPLKEDDGGGWIAIVPDLPGCQSDGSTGGEAFRNVLDAIDAWKATAREEGRPIPRPGSFMVEDMATRVPDFVRQQAKHFARQIHDQLPSDVPDRDVVNAIVAEFARTALRSAGLD